MSQVTIYLDKETEEKIDKAARAAGLSRSKWIRKLIQGHTAREWPQHVVDLAGAWPDFPEAEELRARLSQDTPREHI